MKPSCVVFAANRGYALSSSRTELIRAFRDKGWDVVLATADDDESRALCGRKVHLEPVSFKRSGFAPWTDLTAYFRMLAIYRKWGPALIQHFHAKPVIFGSLAAKHALRGKTCVVNTITGLGHAFIAGGFLGRLAGLAYSVALPLSDVTIFQNSDDRALFLNQSWVSESRARLIAGSGVDTTRFFYTARQQDGRKGLNVLMLGRLLRQKGITEFVEVARRIHLRWPEVQFLWAGEEDVVHPDAVSSQWLKNQEGVKYLGRLSDVVPALAEADLLLFPSYREGVPRVILEASAMGLPTVGFDVPGVREVVRDGCTGYLVPYRDVDSLTNCVTDLLENRPLRLKMGKSARQMVEDSFDVKAIKEKYLEVYRSLSLWGI